MLVLELNQEEADVLKSAIKSYFRELKDEILETSSWDLRETLKDREGVLLGIATQLGKKSGQRETATN